MYLYHIIGEKKWKQAQGTVDGWIRYYDLNERGKDEEAEKYMDAMFDIAHDNVGLPDEEQVDLAQDYIWYQKS